MKNIRLLLLFFVSLIGSLVASGQDTPVKAFVSYIEGTATYTLPGSTDAQPLDLGQELPEGAIVNTQAGATLIISSHEGIDTGVDENTTIVVGAHSVSAEGVRTALFDVKVGSTVSVLDPENKAVNNYAIHTPQGVAAARGTVYVTTVTVNGQDVKVTVDTQKGTVAYIVNGKTYSVSEGNVYDSTSGTVVSSADVPAGLKGLVEKNRNLSKKILNRVTNKIAKAGASPDSLNIRINTAVDKNLIITLTRDPSASE